MVFYRFILYILIHTTFLMAIDNIKSADSNKIYYIYNDSIFSLLHNCAKNNTSSCKELIKFGLLSDKECEPNDCQLIGALLSLSNNTNKALSYLTKSCQSNDRLGCTHLAIIYEESRNYKDAEYFYKLSCNNGDIVACYNLGVLYANGKIFDKSPIASKHFFKHACDNYYAKACFNLAVVYANFIHDFENARYFFDKSCDYGIKEGCINAHNLENNGITMPKLQKKRGLYIKPQ